ncbi:glycosyltransferase [Anaerorhabdus furcosa]|uniref:Regulatory protein RecX n=1 Tax=Anaerorhabdus furcosa TaxID=118967 RepID=A0A1T4NCG2_9FIRM|nr:RecX family transcriptional regulator [Anaerorhabdus furcosa]SJZ76488.1 1,2-diacylglycerol 3-alpha-glucosyltransferase [Anaerorhabdus furcosa]
MRIGLFSDTYLPEINGVASSVHILREQLVKNGHKVYVITTKPENGIVEDDPYVLRLSGIELKKLYGYVLTSPIHISAYNEIKEINLDLVHAHTEFSVGIFARIVAKLQGLPLVSTYHTTYEDYTHYVNIINSDTVDKLAKKAVASLSRLYGDSSTEMIAPSQKTKDMLLRYGIKKTIYVVPTGLDLDRFNPKRTSVEKIKEIRSTYGVQDNETLVTFVGRVAQEKSIDFVIDGFTFVKKMGLPCKLLIVGAGPDDEILRQKVKELALEDMVKFAGKKPAIEIPSFYHASNCFVSASITETQGMTYIEALASGLPLFARPDNVLEELVVEDETGYYFKTPQELAEKLKEYLADSDDHKKQMVVNAIEKAKPYDSQEFYRKIYHVYESAIANYSQMYVIEQIKPKNDFIQIYLDSPSSESIKIIVSLDRYFNSGYRKGFKLSQEEIEELQKEEEGVKAYQSCIRKIAVKDRTRKEIYDWLTQNTTLEIDIINKIVEKLEEHGFIDDLKYAKNAVYSMKLTLTGENKIQRNLKKKGIPIEMIEEVMSEDDDTELTNAIKWAEKVKPSIKEKSVKMKKKILRQKLIIQGFSESIIDQVMNNLNFVDDERSEIDNLRKVANKAKKRYERKYSGFKLRNTVFRYCAAMGYDMEDIYVILDEMEWKDE